MSNQRIDTIDRHFVPVKRLEKVSEILFWVFVTLSFSLLFLEDFPIVKEWVNYVFIVVTIAYSVVSLSLGLWILPAAQGHRSTNLIADSLGVALDNETTNKYYNNKQQPSLIRLGLNIFENSLFSLKISSRMLVSERVKICIWIVVMFIVILSRKTSSDLISVVAQTVFTTSLLSDYLRLEISRFQFQRVFNESWNVFLNGIPSIDQSITGVILNLATRYEAIKSSMTVSLDTDIFKEINPSATQKWEQIKARLNIE
ncbi:hypothetical protein [Paenibacillus gansuensis]|uniref:Reticulon-like protein n=1 Tax=Paenibacillus gansuensis TaxID=306542 RepID=A0ABW5P8A8_9BACL